MWFDVPDNKLYEVTFTYKESLATRKELKGYKVVKARSHQQAKKQGYPTGVWVTSVKSRLVK